MLADGDRQGKYASAVAAAAAAAARSAEAEGDNKVVCVTVGDGPMLALLAARCQDVSLVISLQVCNFRLYSKYPVM